MSDYSTMQTRVADELARTDLTAQIKLAILTSIKKYEREPLYFNRKTATFATVANQEYYAAAALADIPNIVTIDSAVIDITGSKLPLTPLGFDEIDAAQTGAVKGDPANYVYFAQQIRLYPIPDAIRTITLAYVYRFATLSAGTDTNAWMTDGEELIRCCAKADLFDNVIREDGNEGQKMEARAVYQFRLLVRESARRAAGARVLRVDPAIAAPPVYNINTG